MATDPHPSPLELEAHHVGEGSPDLASHLAGCAACRGYVADLETDAARFAAEVDPELFLRKVRRRQADAGGAKARLRDYRGVLMAVTAAVALLAVAPVGQAILGSRLASIPAEPADEVRMKGPPQLAIVRLRAGRQSRHLGHVQAHNDDAFRVEISVARPLRLEVVVVDPQGSVTVLAKDRRFAPGTHLLEAFRLTGDTDHLRVIAGPPAGVERAVARQAAADTAELTIASAAAP